MAASEVSVFEATLRSDGAVVKGAQLTPAQATQRRRAGLDVVVCGDTLGVNRRTAGAIEQIANGRAKRCPPHASAGPRALPHYQPDPRPPEGHTFYETERRKAL